MPGALFLWAAITEYNVIIRIQAERALALYTLPGAILLTVISAADSRAGLNVPRGVKFAQTDFDYSLLPARFYRVRYCQLSRNIKRIVRGRERACGLS